MGDRGNIRIIEEEGGTLYFYTHWQGTELPQALAAALDRGRSRWGDESYLSRIIFSEMIRGDVDGTTGAGISTRRGDYNYDDLVVEMKHQRVIDRDGSPLSFDAFIARYSA